MKARTLIIIFGTLVIGFLLGMLTSAQIRYQKLQPVRTFFSEELFRKNIFGTIQPEEQQKAKIDEIIGRYAVLNMTIQTDFRDKFDTMMKDFWSEIEPNLTKEQLDRIEQMEDRRAEMFNRNPDSRPPMDSNNFRLNRNNLPPTGDSLQFGGMHPDMNMNSNRSGFSDSLNYRNLRDSLSRFGRTDPASDRLRNNKQ